MNTHEHVHTKEPVIIAETPPAERTHPDNEHELVAASMQAKLALAEARTVAPERASEIGELQKKLETLITDAKETLRVLGAAAALGAVLSAGELAESATAQKQAELTETLADHPADARQLLDGVIEIAASKETGEGERRLGEEAQQLRKELPQQTHPGQKLAMNIAARVAKICLDLAGFGVVSHVLDLIEDCTKAFLEKRARAAT